MYNFNPFLTEYLLHLPFLLHCLNLFRLSLSKGLYKHNIHCNSDSVNYPSLKVEGDLLVRAYRLYLDFFTAG